jgi:hypothetical protein
MKIWYNYFSIIIPKNMKNHLKLSLFCLALVLIISGCAQKIKPTINNNTQPTLENTNTNQSVPESDAKEYKNDEYGLILKYPPKWIATSTEVSSHISANGAKSLVIFLLKYPDLPANTTKASTPLSQGSWISLEVYDIDIYKNEDSIASWIKNNIPMRPLYEEISIQKVIKKDDLDIYYLVYGSPVSGGTFYDIAFVKNKKLFRFHGGIMVGTDENYKESENGIESIFKSVEFFK